MGFANYDELVKIIGAKYKAGDPEARADFAILCEDILTATSTFEIDVTERVGKIIDDASGREPRPEDADRKAEAARARASVNALADKYGVGHVFDSDPKKVAADMAQVFLDAILRDQ